MKISPKELQILAACETEADLSVTEVASRAGVRDHVVRRALQTLDERGIIHRRAYFNSFLLGTAPFLFAFAFNAEGKRQRRKVHDYLKSLPEVSFFAEVGGRFNLFTEARFRSIYQIQSFLDQLSLRLGNIFEEKEVLALTSMHDLPSLASIKDRKKLREFATSVSSLSVELDVVDTKIVQALSLKWDDSNPRLAQRIGIPLSTLEYHLKRLKKIGLILGSRYYVDFEALGFSVFYHLVSSKGFHPDLRSKLLDFARNDSSVHTFRTFIGPWDFIFECHHQSSHDNIEFVERLVERHSAEIERVESVPALSLQKISDCTVVASN